MSNPAAMPMPVPGKPDCAFPNEDIVRIGDNPLRKKSVLPPYKRHRIIVPVYIPNGEGYFEDAMAIFRMSLASLLATVDLQATSITILDNASVPEVEALVAAELRAGRIDRYVRHAINRGKPDPVAGELKAVFEEFVTIADCDVMFLPGWQREVEELFASYPAAGAVSPSPAPNLLRYATATTWLHGLLSLSIARGAVVDASDLDQFEHSVGKKVFSESARRRQFLVRRRGHAPALLGGGHFVITVRQACYQEFHYEPGLGGTGMGETRIDGRVDEFGRVRLSTPRAHVKHLGNKLEAWMTDTLAQVQAAPAVPCRAEAIPGPDALVRALALLPHRLRYWLGMAIYVVATRLAAGARA